MCDKLNCESDLRKENIIFTEQEAIKKSHVNIINYLLYIQVLACA